MKALQEFGEAIETYTRPKTFPVAIKMLKGEADMPEGTATAKKALGHRLAVCQGWGLARHNGQSLAILKDENTCPLAMVALGLAEPPESWLRGDLYLDWRTPNAPAAEKSAREMPRLPATEYAGLVVAPVHTCNFKPDLVLLYCDPLQASHLIGAALVREDGSFSNTIWPRGGCADFIARPILTGECHFSVPCPGGRRYEATSDDEVVFAVPATRLAEMASGLKYVYQHIPNTPRGITRYLDFEPVFPAKREGYNILAFAQDLGIVDKPDQRDN